MPSNGSKFLCLRECQAPSTRLGWEGDQFFPFAWGRAVPSRLRVAERTLRLPQTIAMPVDGCICPGEGGDFPHPISDLTLKSVYPQFQTLWCMANSATLNRFTAYGTSWRPKRCSRFFFFAINVHGNTRYFKNGIPDQTDGIYTLLQIKMAKSTPYFRLEMLENGTVWGGTYLYGLYMGVPPPPPPPPPGCIWHY